MRVLNKIPVSPSLPPEPLSARTLGLKTSSYLDLDRRLAVIEGHLEIVYMIYMNLGISIKDTFALFNFQSLVYLTT